MSSNRIFWVAVVGVAGLSAACGGGGQSAPPANPPTTAAASTSAAASVAAGDFGVPECDQFMKKYLACVESKVPEAGRAILKQSFEQQKAAWKQAASTPEGRSGLAMGCKAAEEQTKLSLASYNCTW